jgi:YfiH family protein
VFWYSRRVGRVAFAFTDARVDLADLGVAGDVLRPLAADLGAAEVAWMSQVHGKAVATAEPGQVPQADALVVQRPGIAALVRVADCTPIVLADVERGMGAVVHAGRVGMMEGVVRASVDDLTARGAQHLHAWVGPRACGACYEVPADMAAAAAAIEPAAASTTSWGTPAIDVGAAVVAQLTQAGVTVHDIGAAVCTIENSEFFSYRRQGAAAGRCGALVTVGQPL